MNKQLATATVGALLVGGAAGLWLGVPALSSAQTNPPSATAPADPATQAEQGPVRQALDQAVADGTITQDQENALVAKIATDRKHFRRELRKNELIAAADTLGMTPKDVVQALKGGTTLGQLADQHGVDHGTLVNALLVQPDARIDKAVTNGKLGADQAATLKDRVAKRVTNFVENGGPRQHQGG